LIGYQARVARIALAAASDYGFALAGGQALIAHGVVFRPTSDIDLFTDRDDGVHDAARTVATALADAGLDVTETTGLGDVFDGFDHSMVEFEVTGPPDDTVRVQLVRFDRDRQPVMLPIGPVLHLDDVLGTKVAALTAQELRAAVRRLDRMPDGVFHLYGLGAAEIAAVRRAFEAWPR
jgi:hypothetical protein